MIYLFSVFCLLPVGLLWCSVTMRTALSFKVKMAASTYGSVPSSPVLLWRCLTLCSCPSVQFNTPHTQPSGSKIQGTSPFPISPSHFVFCVSHSSSHSKVQTYFKWLCPAPFQLSPELGLLRPGQECHIKVVFQPQEAVVYQQQAHCRFGEDGDKAAESCLSVLLQGLGTTTRNWNKTIWV